MSKEECTLCGYGCEEYYRYAVPLASPPQERIICIECAEMIADWYAAQPAGKDRGTLLTRNHYRLMFVRPHLVTGHVGFRLVIDRAANADLRLDEATFNCLVADLGLQPTSPAATEYESAPLGDTTAGRRGSAMSNQERQQINKPLLDAHRRIEQAIDTANREGALCDAEIARAINQAIADLAAAQRGLISNLRLERQAADTGEEQS